nr:immunoglobulin light chain junction region [Macaca mulatta]MOV93222.1 immunoglobulin light chain junction region [Macaca mulatta]
CHQHDDSPRTF